VVEEPGASDGGLRAVNARLRQVIDRQASELDAARAQIDVLLKRAAEQDARIEQLTAQVAELQQRLGRNSKNSSMPPSAEGLAKKPAVPRKRGQRRPGKQPGAQGRLWPRSPP
jgi:transposase